MHPKHLIVTALTLDADTATVDGNYAFPVSAIRLCVSASPGVVLFDVH